MTFRTLGDGLRASVTSEKAALADQSPYGLSAATDMLEKPFRARMDSLGISDTMQADLLTKARASVQRLVKACESPIEKALAPWLVMQDYGPNYHTVPPMVHTREDKTVGPIGDIIIVPQFRFALYRLDFALISNVGRNVRILAVECDGDIHLDNRARDKERDEYLACFGVRTVRFTGQGVYREPEGTSQRIVAAFLEHAEAN